MVKIRKLITILEREHNIYISKKECKLIIQKYTGRKTTTKLIAHISEYKTNDGFLSDSTEISSYDSEEDGYDYKYMLRHYNYYNVRMNKAVIQHFIQYFGCNKSDEEVAAELRYDKEISPNYYNEESYGDAELVQELIDHQSPQVMIHLLTKYPSGFHFKYYTGEQTDEMLDLIKTNCNNGFRSIYIQYIKQHKQTYILRWLKEDPYIFKKIKIPQTYEICKLAVKMAGYNLRFVDRNLITEDLCMAAVAQNSVPDFEFIPENFQTGSLWLNYLLFRDYGFEQAVSKLPRKYSNLSFFSGLFQKYFKKYRFGFVCELVGFIPEQYRKEILIMLQHLKK